MKKPSPKSPDSTKADQQPKASGERLFPLPKGSEHWLPSGGVRGILPLSETRGFHHDTILTQSKGLIGKPDS